MTAIEKALAYWEEFQSEIDGLYYETNKAGRLELDKQRPAVAEAISALQEKIKREKECKPLTQGFTVIDTKTGEYPDLRGIVLNEDWAEGLMYCDMEGFAIQEDGYLILMDECGNCTYAPAGRFEIRPLKEDAE